MNYEEKYNEALERAKRLHGEPTGGTERIVCEQIFPELKDSEYEKVRKVIMGCCIDHGHKYGCFGVTMEDMCAWLEKQSHKLDPDKVVEWLYEQVNSGSMQVDNITKTITTFKEDFGL